jgi:hypothetical protein
MQINSCDRLISKVTGCKSDDSLFTHSRVKSREELGSFLCHLHGFSPGERGTMILLNTGTYLRIYMASKAKRLHCQSLYIPSRILILLCSVFLVMHKLHSNCSVSHLPKNLAFANTGNLSCRYSF